MSGMQIIVDEVLEVEVLQNSHQFKSNHQSRFQRELSPAIRHLPSNTAVQLFEHDEVEVFLLAAPVHIGDTDSSLHTLVHLPLLQQAQSPSSGLDCFGLFSLQQKGLVSLRMHCPVEQGFMLAFQLGVKAKSAHQPHLHRPHSNNNIENQRVRRERRRKREGAVRIGYSQRGRIGRRLWMDSLMLSRSVRNCKEVPAVSVVFSVQNMSGLKMGYLFLSSFDFYGQICSLYKLSLILSRRFSLELMILVSYSVNCWEVSQTSCLVLAILLLCASICVFLSYFCLMKNRLLRQYAFTYASPFPCEPASLYANSSSLLCRSSIRSFLRQRSPLVAWMAFSKASSFLDVIYCSVIKATWFSLAFLAYSTISLEILTRELYSSSLLTRYAPDSALICLSSSILYTSSSFLSNSTSYDCPIDSSMLCRVFFLIDSSSLSSQTTFSPFSSSYRLISCWISRGLRDTSSIEYSLYRGTFFLCLMASVMVISISTG